jgi:hypothetical protein
MASSEGYEYLFIDSCCIDQSSSAALSEAVNSMFEWYRLANVCYTYLSDIGISGEKKLVSIGELMKSRWFTRGWTLQQLIAPDAVRFFSADWTECGNRHDLALYLYEITNIDPDVLSRPPKTDVHEWLYSHSIAKRMSWAAMRETKRPEDKAYCLLGLFNVHMPLLYGEGGPRAFHRLQEEIMKYSPDQTILAWSPAYQDFTQTMSVLADSPSAFRDASRMQPIEDNNRIEMTSRGVRTGNRLYDLNQVLPYGESLDNGKKVILLSCVFADDPSGQLGIAATQIEDEQTNGSYFVRVMHAPVVVPVKQIRDEVGPATRLLSEIGNHIPFGDWEYSRLKNEQLLMTRMENIQKYLQELRVAKSIYIAQNIIRRQRRDVSKAYCYFPLLVVRSDIPHYLTRPARRFSLVCPALEMPYVDLWETSTARFDISQQSLEIFLTEMHKEQGPHTSPAQVIMKRSWHDATRYEVVQMRCHCETAGKHRCSSAIFEPGMADCSFVRCYGYGVEMQVRISHDMIAGKLFNVVNITVKVFGVAQMIPVAQTYEKRPSKLRGFLGGKTN